MGLSQGAMRSLHLRHAPEEGFCHVQGSSSSVLRHGLLGEVKGFRPVVTGQSASYAVGHGALSLMRRTRGVRVQLLSSSRVRIACGAQQTRNTRAKLNATLSHWMKFVYRDKTAAYFNGEAPIAYVADTIVLHSVTWLTSTSRARPSRSRLRSSSLSNTEMYHRQSDHHLLASKCLSTIKCC
jgi:hypothetical protein